MADDVQTILATAFNELAAGLTAAATNVSLTTISAATAQADSNTSTNGPGTRDGRTSSQSGGSSTSGASSTSGGSSSGGASSLTDSLSSSLFSLVSPAAAGAESAATSSASTAEKIASFLPMGGLVEGLIGLFSGGSSAPAPLTKYAMPAKAEFTSNLNANGTTSAADYGQNGLARGYGDSSSGSSSSPSGSSTPINLTINALDSQSILSRADDIAAAVRGAMLNGNSINDVINNDL
jgi:hypothetical protein